MRFLFIPSITKLWYIFLAHEDLPSGVIGKYAISYQQAALSTIIGLSVRVRIACAYILVKNGNETVATRLT